LKRGEVEEVITAAVVVARRDDVHGNYLPGKISGGAAEWRC
jgi:hypothetical protein